MEHELAPHEHENMIRRLESFLAGNLDGPIRRLFHELEQKLEAVVQRVERIHMTLQNLEDLITAVNGAIDTVTTEVNDLIAKLNGASGGLSAAEAAQLATDLQATLAKIQAIAPETPPAP